MATTDQIEIHLGLPEQHRRQAAELLYKAFERKFQPVMKSADHGVPILAQGLVPTMMIIARGQQQIVGVVGLHYYRQNFWSPHLASFATEFGWLSGLIRFVMFRLFIAGEGRNLVVEAIAVDESRRGQGTGTRLLEAAFDYARQHGFQSVSLEVVDTNPAARRLYERLGFVATRTWPYPYLRNFMGFSAATTMVKQMAP
ncbi:MAG: GNAT family N-acetyltransferase [Anaerolineae bacterium]|nr:GNAT family N-acetyltransferase [Anaerolineae bacterium]